MIPRAARPNLETVALGLERPRPPLHRSLQPERPVLADGTNAATEVGRLAAGARCEQVDERRLERPWQPRPLLAERAQVGVGSRMQPPQQRQDLVPDQPAGGLGVGRIDPHREAVSGAVRARLLAGDVEQRAHDAVRRGAP